MMALLRTLNRPGGRVVTTGVFLLSKYVNGYKDLCDLNVCVCGAAQITFLECLERGMIPEEVIVEATRVPLIGVVEILAASRLVGDTDVLGGGAKNAGFIIERNEQQQPVAVRAVKIDAGNHSSLQRTLIVFTKALILRASLKTRKILVRQQSAQSYPLESHVSETTTMFPFEVEASPGVWASA